MENGLDLEGVLRRIVAAASDLVDAPYAGLGVLAADGAGLEEFVHVGLDDVAAEAVRRPPEVDGPLGAILGGARPIRFEDLTADPRADSFSDGHPTMRGFLGVPIRVGEEVSGALYLATPSPRGFTPADEELVSSLAATAAVAVENARQLQAMRRQQDWLRASTDLTQQMLTAAPDEVFTTIGNRVRELARADVVTVAQPTPDGEHLIVEVAVGVGQEQLLASTHALEHTLSQHVLDSGTPLVADISQDGVAVPGWVYAPGPVAVGPVMVLPLVGARTSRGVLAVARLRGSARFTADELEMATAFANHASIALELAEARRDQQRMALLEDRARIARDLHDHVIQQLFAAGMGVQVVASGLDDPRAAQLEEVVGRVDEAIRQIRASIFQLTPHRFAGLLRTAVLEVAAEVTPVLGFSPEVSFDGPVDILSDPLLAGDVAAVVREGLTNVARHASATRAQVEVSGDAGRITVCVTDDGVGLGETERRSGLDNIRRRAEHHAGRLTIEDAAPGTRLVWSAAVG